MIELILAFYNGVVFGVSGFILMLAIFKEMINLNLNYAPPEYETKKYFNKINLN